MKKLIAVLLMAMMIFTLFTACGSDEGGKKDNGTVDNPNTPDTPEEPEEPTPPTVPEEPEIIEKGEFDNSDCLDKENNEDSEGWITNQKEQLPPDTSE